MRRPAQGPDPSGTPLPAAGTLGSASHPGVTGGSRPGYGVDNLSNDVVASVLPWVKENDVLRLIRLCAALIVGTLVLAGCGSGEENSLEDISGYVVVPDDPMGPSDGSVTQADGSTWSYRDVADGTITFLYFGYTSCPDVCPTTMADLAHSIRELPEADQAKVSVQLVSTDPERDTPAQITRWLGGFNPEFKGGRADINDVIDQAKTYGIGIDPPQVSKSDYQVTHGAQVLVLKSGGGAVGYFDELAGTKTYSKAIPLLVAKYT